jgi:hypothetical protein
MAMPEVGDTFEHLPQASKNLDKIAEYALSTFGVHRPIRAPPDARRS